MSQEKNNKQIADLLLWPALLAITLLSIAFVLQWLLSLELDEGFWELLSFRWLAAAVVIQGIIALAVVFAWKKNLQLHGLTDIYFSQAAAMIGINSIGKYSPGKVLGILGRGAALYRMHGNGGLAIQATIVEQIAMLHSGGAAVLTGWILYRGQPLTAVLILGAAVASVVFVSRSGKVLVATAIRLLRKEAFSPETMKEFETSYKMAFTMMILVWGLSTLALYCCVLTFDSHPTLSFWWLLWVLTLAYLGGFAAFLLPAGIGAREGVLLAFLATQLDTNVAAYVVVLHRLLTILIDLLLGGWALLSGKHLLLSK